MRGNRICFYCDRLRRSYKVRSTYSPSNAQWPFAVMCTDSSTTWWSCLRLAVAHQTPTTFSWAIMSIEGTTVLRLSHFWSALRCVLRIELRFFEETTSLVRSLKSTASTMNVSGSMEMLTCGNTWPIYSTICLWQRSWRIKFSACMEVYHPLLTPSTWSGISIELLRCHTRVPCATCFGQILTIERGGVSPHVAPATPSDKTSRISLYRKMALRR